MKKRMLTLLTVILVSIVSNAQTKQEAAVAKACEELRTAMIDGNRAVLDKLAANALSYGHSGGHIDDKKEFVEKIASGKSDFVTIDITEQTIQVTGNVAVVRHILSAKTNDGGKPGEVHLRILLVWQKQKGGWKLLARQAVKIT